MKLFWDTNIMFDFLGERDPFYISAAKIATLADKREVTVVASALSYATISYLLAKYESIEKIKDKLRKFKVISEICELDEVIIEKGQLFSDYEEAEVVEYMRGEKIDLIVDLNIGKKDFTAYTMDLTKEYIEINADYRS